MKIQCFIYKSEFEDQLLNCTCHKEHEEHKEHKEHEEHEEQKEQRNIRNIRNKRNKRNIRKEHKEQKEHKNHKEMESVRDPLCRPPPDMGSTVPKPVPLSDLKYRQALNPARGGVKEILPVAGKPIKPIGLLVSDNRVS